MQRTLTAVAALLLLGATTTQAKPSLTSEQKLEKALEGRVAGKPVDCIYQRDIRSSRIFDRIGILYEMNNGTYYLNRPRGGANSLDQFDILVTNTHSPQLCSIDVVHLVDQGTRMQNGFVGLDKFVPYKKAARARTD